MPISLSDLLKTVPIASDLPSVKAVRGVEKVEAGNPYFVEPTLSLETECTAPSLILIAAPAAVGKSTVAREIARRQNAPYWDLAKFRVGTNTFTGTLGQSYGAQYGTVLTELAAGNFLLVIDALDEAHVRAGTEALEEFLDDLVNQTLQPRARPTVILLGRVDTVDFAEHLYLSESKVPYSRYKLDYFDHARALDFIDKHLDRKRAEDGGKVLHRDPQRRSDFEVARDDLFQLVYDLLARDVKDPWSSSEVSDFLGYAPVLDALAEYLGHPNLQVVLNQIVDARNAMEGINASKKWHFLRKIIATLQSREQEKMHNSVRHDLGAIAKQIGWDDWDKLYNSEEQSARLLANFVSGSVKETLPTQLLPIYSKAVASQLPTHPFRGDRNGFAGIVFEEYIYAWAMTRRDEMLPDVRERLASASYRPTPILAHFIATMPWDNHGPALDAEDFGYFYDSVMAAAVRRGDVRLRIETDARGTLASLEAGEGEKSEKFMVNIRSAESGVHFGANLSFADISIDHPVHLGSASRPLLLGPGVHITCSELVLEAEQVEVLLEQHEDVSLAAKSFRNARAGSGSKLSFPKSEAKGGTLRVWWPNVGHPWNPYKDQALKIIDLSTFSLHARCFLKFVQMFVGERQRAVESVETARLEPQERSVRDDLIRLAMKRGVLTKTQGGHGPAYHFNNDFGSLKRLVGATDAALTQAAQDFAITFLGQADFEQVVAAAEPNKAGRR